MSGPPPLPPSYGQPPQKSSCSPWMACGVGCLVSLVLVVVVVFAGMKLARWSERMAAQWEEMERNHQRQVEVREELEALDARHPSRIGEDLETAVLSTDDVDRYLSLHAALAERMQAHEELTARMDAIDAMFETDAGEPAVDDVSFADLKEVVLGARDAMTIAIEREVARTELLEAAREALDERAMGLVELRRLSSSIDWRFLKRDGASAVGLSPDDARALTLARATVELWDGETFAVSEWDDQAEREEVQADVEAARTTVERLEALAAQVGLSEASRTLLESRRSELEAVTDERALLLFDVHSPDPEAFWLHDDAELEGEAAGSELGAPTSEGE